MDLESLMNVIRNLFIISTGKYKGLDDNDNTIVESNFSSVIDDDTGGLTQITPKFLNPSIIKYNLETEQEVILFAPNTKDNIGYTINDLWAIPTKIISNYTIDISSGTTISFTGYGEDLMVILNNIIEQLVNLKTVGSGQDLIDPTFTSSMITIQTAYNTFLGN